MRTGRDGHSSADAVVETISAPAASAAQKRLLSSSRRWLLEQA
jgi:hypothetical protein